MENDSLIDRKFFKSENSFLRFNKLKSSLRKILFEMLSWCEKENLIFLITETLTTEDEDKSLNRISVTHREGRAADLSVRGWGEDKVTEFCNYFGSKYKDQAAIAKTGEKKLVIYHNNGNGDHIHIQVNRREI